MEITSPLTTVFVYFAFFRTVLYCLSFLSFVYVLSTRYARLICIMEMKLYVIINQVVNTPYLTLSNLAPPIFSGWLSLQNVWYTGNYSVFYLKF